MAGLTGQWQEQLSEEFHKEYYQKLFLFVKEQYSKVPVYPPAEELFNAFHLTPFEKVKVVILGQDPYHNTGQAHGLSFSVKPGWRFRRHLLIFIKNFTMIWDAIFQIMAIWNSGQSKACFC